MIFEETVVLEVPFAEALARTKEAFAAEGFGTLTEIDVQATLADKIGKEMDPYVIVGACNPGLAGQALDAEPQIGVLLPCNVVVRQIGGNVVVEAMDPGLMATIVGTESIRPVADEARRLVSNAMERLASSQ
ncbi:MAG TPA: ABC transporter ATP-binding protein [Acidimicrobiaceae bacterium]|nr:ABC transporter ATP-binding protein [Acidimicrobiaceae bacterium]